MINNNYKVIYLTGAPATGKSTIAQAIRDKYKDIVYLSYSDELMAYINNIEYGSVFTKDSIREKSSEIITKEDIGALDKLLVSKCNKLRNDNSIIIDSHPVTKEDYGFRVTGFNLKILQQLSPDIIICLYAEPEVILERIKNDPEGRKLPSHFDVQTHVQSQISLSITYGIITDSPVYLIDSDAAIDQLTSTVLAKCKIT